MEGDEEAAPNPTRQDLEKLREDTQANEKSGGGIVITRKLGRKERQYRAPHQEQELIEGRSAP
jgi:hypothetical protein